MKSSWNNGTENYRFATTDDLQDFAEMLSDPEVGRWLWFTPAPPETFKMFFTPLLGAQIEQLERGEIPTSAVITVEDLEQTFLGQGAVIAVDGSPGGFEIGFQLLKSSWGRGIGKRLALFLCAYAVHLCDAYRIEGACLEGNAASRKILTDLGLRLEGTRPGYRLRDGVRHAELLYGSELQDLDCEPFNRTARKVGLL